MKELSEILLLETSVPIIFGHIHRRQHELGCFRTDDGDMDFRTASARDIYDYAFCLNFFSLLSQGYRCISYSVSQAQSDAEDALSNAARELNVDNPMGRTRSIAGAVTQKVLFGSFETDPIFEKMDAYRAIYPREMQFDHTTVQKAA